VTLVSALLLLVVAGVEFNSSAEENHRTIVVPDEYPTIQAAIANATAGDTVFVKNGIYYDSFQSPIIVDKPLSLIGEDRQNTVIIGEWNTAIQAPPVIWVAADNVTISGFTLRDSSRAGVWIEHIGMQGMGEPFGCVIIGNIIVNNTEGIHSFGGVNLKISGNNIMGNVEYGIYHWSSNSIISDNNLGGNLFAAIIVDSCSNVTISGNSITGNGGDETFSLGGLLIRWDGPFYVYENSITDNQGSGIQFGEGCNNSTVRENSVERNTIGIELLNYPFDGVTMGSGNTVYNNNLINNSEQVLINQGWNNWGNFTWDNGTDIVSWDNGSRGNYWSDYLTRYPNATEIDSQGIGNTPYVIDANDTDNFPLMQPVAIHTQSPSPTPTSTPTPNPTPTAISTPNPTSTPTTSPTAKPQPTVTPNPSSAESLSPEPTSTPELPVLPSLIILPLLIVAIMVVLVYFIKRR
jgi:nitrous oxidase accessory protein NosD